MTQKIINIGTSPNKGDGDVLRTAFGKINDNFTELYATDTSTKYHLGDDTQFVDIDADTGMIVIQSGFDTSMPVYIKGANCADGGVGGNVVIEAGGPPLGELITGTVGNIELAAQQTTIESNNNMWTFRDDGVLELPADGDIVNSTGTSVLGVSSSSDRLVNGSNEIILGTDGLLTLPGTGTINNTSTTIGGTGTIHTFALDADGAASGIDNTNEIWLSAIPESIEIAAGWIITFANSTQQTIVSNTVGVTPPHTGQRRITWSGNITLTGSDVWPLTIQSSDYSEGSSNASLELTPNGTTTWSFGQDGRTTFPNGTVPEHSYGAAGDKEGMVVFSDPYIYYCKQDYVDNTTDIWVRVAWTGTNW